MRPILTTDEKGELQEKPAERVRIDFYAGLLGDDLEEEVSA